MRANTLTNSVYGAAVTLLGLFVAMMSFPAPPPLTKVYTTKAKATFDGGYATSTTCPDLLLHAAASYTMSLHVRVMQEGQESMPFHRNKIITMSVSPVVMCTSFVPEIPIFNGYNTNNADDACPRISFDANTYARLRTIFDSSSCVNGYHFLTSSASDVCYFSPSALACVQARYYKGLRNDCGLHQGKADAALYGTGSLLINGDEFPLTPQSHYAATFMLSTSTNVPVVLQFRSIALARGLEQDGKPYRLSMLYKSDQDVTMKCTVSIPVGQ